MDNLPQGQRTKASPRRFGKYDLVRKLAAGGMAEVFLARQVSIGGFEKDVVIKRILPLHSNDDRFAKRFMREARLAARLNHPNIAQIYDVGIEEGTYYIAMEYIIGRDMRHVVRRSREIGRPLLIGHAAKIVSGAALGLSRAHSATDGDGKALGIVHGDISPTNILLSVDGSVKIVDFGIAHATRQPTESETDRVSGKHGYMAPEQIRGEKLDARADLFSLGVLLYEWTMHTRLFGGESALLTDQATLERAIPRPTMTLRLYPVALERIVLRALDRDPRRRYSSALRMHEDLEDFLAHSEHGCSTSDLANFLRGIFPDIDEPPEITGVEQIPIRAAVGSEFEVDEGSAAFPWVEKKQQQRTLSWRMIVVIAAALTMSAVLWYLVLG